MSKAAESTRIRPYLTAELHKRFKRYCKAHNHSESSVVQAALQEYLDETKDMTLLLRRLDRQQRALGRLQRDQDIFMEAFSVFVQLWYSYKPELKGEEKKAAQQSGYKRYQLFVDYVSKQYGGGHRFINDLADDLVDESQLQTLVEDNE